MRPTFRSLTPSHTTRGFAGFAYNTPNPSHLHPSSSAASNHIKTCDLTAGLKSKVVSEPGSVEAHRGMHVAAGFSSSAMWQKKPIYEDPELEVVNAGLGSVLVARLPQPPDSCLTSVDRRLTAHGGISNALSRRLTGSNALLQQFWTAAESGDVILAPKRPGDIAVLKLDGSSEYYVRRSGFLAATERTLASEPSPSQDTVVSTVSFSPQRRIPCSPEHLVAWDAAIDPSPELKDVDLHRNTNPVPCNSHAYTKAAETAASKALEVASKVGWSVLRWIGWVGKVYRAVHLPTSNPVALKLIPLLTRTREDLIALRAKSKATVNSTTPTSSAASIASNPDLHPPPRWRW
ncbi:hypothetical protein BC829DRAFT_444160 [Chytridium lagenaria]|nr:hypothetical protein BC829DRAFT_444160 [Chytridium lagenaria]